MCHFYSHCDNPVCGRCRNCSNGARNRCSYRTCLNKFLAKQDDIIVETTTKIAIFRREIRTFIVSLRKTVINYLYKYPHLKANLEHVLRTYDEDYSKMYDILRYWTHHPGNI